VSNITRSCQRSAETLVQHQPNLCPRSGDHGMSNVKPDHDKVSGSPGNRTLNLRIKSLLPRNRLIWALVEGGRLTSGFRCWSFRVIAGCFGWLAGFLRGEFGPRGNR
jgi:hypothetical protein